MVDIYEAAGIPKPELSELNRRVRRPGAAGDNPQLAIEALRKAILEEIGRVTRSNSSPGTGVLRAGHCVDEPLHQLAAHLRRGHRRAGGAGQGGCRGRPSAARSSTPPLDHDQLAFYDAVAANESAVLESRRGRAGRDRARVGSHHAPGRTHRLDRARGRTGKAAVVDQAAPGEVRLPTGQAAEARSSSSWSRWSNLRRAMRTRGTESGSSTAECQYQAFWSDGSHEAGKSGIAGRDAVGITTPTL